MAAVAGDAADRAAGLTARALGAAVRGDQEAASAALAAVSTETGGEGVAVSLQAMCDTIIGLQQRAQGIPADGDVREFVRVVWVNARTGRAAGDADEVPLPVRWAGRLVMARAARDLPQYRALIGAMPSDGWERGAWAGVLLDACAAAWLAATAGDDR